MRTRDRLHTIDGRLFQARMWGQYAAAIRYDRPTPSGVDRAWCLQIGRWSYEECKRRARVNLYLAHRLNRTMKKRRCDLC